MMKRLLTAIMILLIAVAPVALAKSKPVKGIKLEPNAITLEVGVSTDLDVVFKPSGASSQLKWQSSNPSVAEVDMDGVVRAVGPGTATIACKTKNGKTAKCKVTVSDPEKVIALTFDDGPVANTLKILEILKQNDIKATFFMVGANVDANPQIAKAVADAGCEIGSHSVDHKDLTKLTLDEAKAQLSNSFASIERATGVKPTLLRPPYGAMTPELAAALDVPVINWMLDTEDWKSRNTDSVVKMTMENLKPLRIVLMHDLYDTTTEAVRQLIPKIKSQGYTFVTITELLERRGITEPNGQIIY